MILFRTLLRTALATGPALALAACIGSGAKPEVPPAEASAVSLGHVHGCESGFTDARRAGYEAGHYVKLDDLYAHDPDYRRGWDQGHAECFEAESRHPRIAPEQEIGP